MEITYKTDSQSNLVMTIKVHTATDYKKVDDKLYTHSEYDAEWDNKLCQWREKEYFERDHIERYEGRQSVIFELTFSSGRAKRKEFIQELNEYFDEYARSFDTIDYVERKSIKDL
jgi:hypothetical protein